MTRIQNDDTYTKFLAKCVNKTDYQNDVETIDNVFKLFEVWFKWTYMGRRLSMLSESPENPNPSQAIKSKLISFLKEQGFAIEKEYICGIELVKVNDDIYKEFFTEYTNRTDNQNDIETIDCVFKLFKMWFRENFTEKVPSKNDLLTYLKKQTFAIEKGYIHGIKLIDDVKD